MAKDPAILFAKPEVVSAEDKKRLSAAGVIVIEVEDPASVRLIRPHAELSGSDLLACAARAICACGDYVRTQFGTEVAKALGGEHQK